MKASNVDLAARAIAGNLTLSYPRTPASDVDVFQSSKPASRDNDAEGALVFSRAAQVTAGPLRIRRAPPTVATKSDGRHNFGLALAAFGRPGDPSRIIEGLSGAKETESAQ